MEVLISLSPNVEELRSEFTIYCVKKVLGTSLVTRVVSCAFWQIPSLPSVFESHGMDLRWQGWVSSLYGIISFFVAPVRPFVS